MSTLRRAVVLAGIFLLNGCGESDNTSAGAATVSAKPKFQASQVSQVVGSVWTKCADENALCAFKGIKAVRFGVAASNKWSETLIFNSGAMDGVRCENLTSFYYDPVPGVFKECQITDVTMSNIAQRATQGEWSPLESWPIIPVNVALLPSGRVVANNATNDDLWPSMSVIARVWDPLANTLISVDSRNATLKSELFCTGLAHMADGNMLYTGSQPNVGGDHDRNATRFNYFTQQWSREADTNYYRYYPSVAELPNGDMITFAGTRASAPAEVLTFDGTWRSLTGMSLNQNFNYYAWGQTAPNGQLFYAGPDQAMRYISPAANGSMKELGARDEVNRNYGSYAMYDIGKMLIAGGAQPVVSSAVTIDLNGTAPIVTPTSSMAFKRRHNNLTILADGSVLVTGGQNDDSFNTITPATAVLASEVWNPSTGKWTTLAAMQRLKEYHSTALLLPDGRVLSGGTGFPFLSQFSQHNVEIFSPPYLFNADGSLAKRPVIQYTPDSVGYAGKFNVTVDTAADIARVHLIKLGAVTHGNNQGQRLVPTSFSLSGNTLSVNAPSSPNIAPPGYYMLVVVNKNGTPSIAKMIHVQQFSVVKLVSRSTGKALEVAGGANKVQMMGDAEDAHLSQMWDLVPTDGGFFKLVSRSNGMVLSVPNNSLQGIVGVQALPDTGIASQQWEFVRSTLGYFTIKARHSHLLLDVAYNSNQDGASVIQQTQNIPLTANQEWEVIPVGLTRLTGVQSGKSMDIYGKSLSDGAAVVIHPWNGGANQMFRFIRDKDGYITLRSAYSGKVVGVSGGSTASITPLNQQTYSGVPSQQWALLPQKDGSFMIQARHSGQFMNVLYDKIDTASVIGQYPDNGGLPNQYWRIVPAISMNPHEATVVAGRALASAHVATIGWLPIVAASNVLGQPETGNSLEAIKISVAGVKEGLHINYRAHLVGGAWQGWVADNAVSGTTGQSLAIDGFEATLSGNRANCTIQYRSYVSGSGWQIWALEGKTSGAGTQPLKALQMRVECLDAPAAYIPSN